MSTVMRRSRSTSGVRTAFARRVAGITAAVVACALLLPGLANADLTISTVNSGVTYASCSWTATTATATVSSSVLDSCLAGSGATLTDSYAPITFTGSSFSDSSCASTLTLDDTQSGGGVEINEPVDLSGNSSCELKTTVVGDVTEGTSGSLTVPTLYLDGTGSVGGTGADLESADNNIATTYGTLSGSYALDDVAPLLIDQLSADPEVDIDDSGGIDVAGKITATEVALGADDSTLSGGAVDERSTASIDASLMAAEGTSVDLAGSNQIAAVLEILTLTNATLDDSESNGLAVGELASDGTVSLVNTGSIEIGELAGPTVSVTSSAGSITELNESGDLVGGNSVTVSAPDGAVSLAGSQVNNAFTALSGTAGSGGFTATNDDQTDPLALGPITSAGAVAVTNPASELTVNGELSGTAITLDGDGLSGDGGSLAAPSIALQSVTSGDTWTLGPGSVTDGAQLPISYSGASSLAVNATGTFNVTASPTTAFTVTGGTPASSTLNYNAQGRTVSGTTSAPTGVIDSPTVQPVSFTNMKSVNLSDLATPAATTTSAPAITPSTQTSPPKCTLSAVGKVVELAKGKKGKAKPRKSAKLDLKASCNEAASLHLTGKVTVAPGGKPRHGSKTYSLSAVNVKLTRPGSVTLAVEIPAAAATALAERPGKSATFSLAATNAGTTGTAKLDISRLR